METVPEVAEKVFHSPDRFEHKRILFIPSESYCAATITIIQGLDELGFRIFTPFKQNINSHFCNTLWHPGDDTEFDFLLSNLHWGTRFDFYSAHGLNDHFRVLIDGDDSRHGRNWLARYEGWCKVYPEGVPYNTAMGSPRIQSHRWMMPLGDYEPDLVFSAQKAPEDEDAIYLPFGLQHDYIKYATPKPWDERMIAVAHIPGDGPKRLETERFINHNLHLFPMPTHNSKVMGPWKCAQTIEWFCKNDKNIHSWHRWRAYPNYYDLLSNSKILIYPGIFDFPQYESKRQWEALACGALVLWARPTIDTTSYSFIADESAVYDSFPDLVSKCNHFIDMGYAGEILAERYRERALNYFSPMALARRFLWYVAEEMGL